MIFGRKEDEQLIPLAKENPQQQYTEVERLRYAVGKLREENRRLNTVLLNEERIQRETEKRMEAEAELRIERKRMTAAYNEQQNQLIQQKKRMETVQRKSFENQLMNDIYYKFIKESGMDFDFKGARERAHAEAMLRDAEQ